MTTGTVVIVPAVAPGPAARARARVVPLVGAMACILALAGSCAALVRLESRWSNPNGIAISHPKREPLPGGRGSFEQLSPDGSFYAVVQGRTGEPAHEVLLVVDAVRGRVVGQLPGAATGASLRYAGWRSPNSVWVSAVELSAGTCVAAYSAAAPLWRFAPDDCSRRPEDAGVGFEHRTAPSPDGQLVARTVYDRSRRRGLLESGPIADVRLEDRDGRFLTQLGNITLVGWAGDGSLIAIDGSDGRPYRIARSEIDSLLRRD
jgi:hypothetical protein